MTAPKTRPYFTAQARKAFTEAGGDPAHADALAAWADALRTGPSYDSRIGVIVREDGTLLAETRHVPATGWSPGATYVVTELDPAAAEVRDQEVGLACGALRRITGQGVIHVTASKVCTGAGKFLDSEEEGEEIRHRLAEG